MNYYSLFSLYSLDNIVCELTWHLVPGTINSWLMNWVNCPLLQGTDFSVISHMNKRWRMIIMRNIIEIEMVFWYSRFFLQKSANISKCIQHQICFCYKCQEEFKMTALKEEFFSFAEDTINYLFTLKYIPFSNWSTIFNSFKISKF